MSSRFERRISRRMRKAKENTRDTGFTSSRKKKWTIKRSNAGEATK